MFGTMVGGPLMGGFMLSRNYLNLGKNEQARNALWGSVAFTLLAYGVLFSLPQTALQSMPSLGGIIDGVVLSLYVSFQKALVLSELRQGAGKLSAGIIFLQAVGFAILAVTLAFLVAFIVSHTA